MGAAALLLAARATYSQKVLYTVTLYSKYTRALTLENFR
jgi:hypothetical protein